jgi:nucleoside-diphosphate-sugar epimerase
MTTARHVIFGTGAIGLATLDALRRRGETVRLVNRSGHARVPDDVEVVGGDASDPAFTTAVAHGAAVVYQTLNPPYPQWTAQLPALQAGVLAAAEAAGDRLVNMENVYMYGRPAGRPLTEDRAHDAHTKKGQLRGRMARELLAAHRAGHEYSRCSDSSERPCSSPPSAPRCSTSGDRCPPCLRCSPSRSLGGSSRWAST